MALGDAYTTAGVGAGGALGAEAVVASIPIQPSTGEGGQGNVVRFSANFPAAVATAVITLKIRQGGLAGTVVGTFGPFTVGTAAAGACFAGSILDATAAAAGQATYSLTGTGSGGTSGAGATYLIEVTPAGVNG